ncbi:DUF4291 domain-containing protein [Deinococcus pimensis]|uniref:DUF4291 domain-containing protein n=1 Tax=Deinococcus pimensis TaxID=309888 RepID=UPI001FE13CED|nr:DUF4291 domain-containing protein [Deinococcus pimensis]
MEENAFVPLPTAPYLEQQRRWPRAGRHVLAQHDDHSVIVYQAYRPEIGHFAARHGRFGSGFSFSRMTWIKPNFLWMMYRSGWGTKPDQEVTLALTLSRVSFEALLRDAVPSSYDPSLYPTREAWQDAVSVSDVRVQWDPDHDPTGRKLERRALQLGLRGDTLRRFNTEILLGVEDVSDLVRTQREHVTDLARLVTPVETLLVPRDPAVAARLRLDAYDEDDVEDPEVVELAALRRYGLVPEVRDLPAIHEALDAEAARGMDGHVLKMRVHCLQLFTHGRVEDALRIWRAKASSFDAGCSVDYQFVCGAGVTATKANLRALGTPEALDLLAFVEASESNGGFEDWTPEAHLAFYRGYYGLDA